MRIMLRTDATLLAERYAGSRPNNKKNRRIVFPVNTVVFLAVTLSMLIGAEETGRWKLVAVAIASILVQASVRELLPGLAGAVVAVLVAVAYVGAALVTWCGIERKMTLKILGAYFGFSIVLSLFSATLAEMSA